MGLGCGVWRREIVEGRLLQQARDYNETGRRESKGRGNDQPMSLEGDGRIDGDIFISNSVVICRWEDACGTVWVLRRCFTVLSAPSDAPSSEHLPLFSLSLPTPPLSPPPRKSWRRLHPHRTSSQCPPLWRGILMSDDSSTEAIRKSYEGE